MGRVCRVRVCGVRGMAEYATVRCVMVRVCGVRGMAECDSEV